MAKQDYYETLGVQRNANKEEIAAAYRKKAMEYHPDRNPGDTVAIEKFKFCAEAFEVLHNDDKRAAYDRYGHAGVDGMGGAHQFQDINEIFGSFGDLFGSIFGGGRSRGRQVRQGADVRCQLSLTLNEAARGVTKHITFRRRELCETCHGNGCRPGSEPERCPLCGGSGNVVRSTGFFQIQSSCMKCGGLGKVISDPCPDCHASGLVAQTVEREVKVPAGVDSGTRLRIQGEGEKSPDGGPPGDCYVFIEVQPHPLFHRDGQDLICRIPIGYAQAALGAEIEVPTLDGREKMKILPGTQNNDVKTLRGRGMPVPRRNMAGDLHFQFYIEVPKHLTPEHRELLTRLAEFEHESVLPERKSFFSKLTGYIHDFFLDERRPDSQDAEKTDTPDGIDQTVKNDKTQSQV